MRAPENVEHVTPITIVKREYQGRERTFEKHLHSDQIQFFCFEKGKAIVRAGKGHLSAKQGDIIFINANESHCVERVTDSVTCFIVIISLSDLETCMPAGCIDKYLSTLKKNLVWFHNKIEDKATEATLKNIIACAAERNPGYELRMLSFAYGLLSDLFERQVDRALSENRAQRLGQTHASLQQVFDYIDESYCEKIKLSQLADIAGLSEGYFCARFKQVTSKNFSDYLNQLRIEKAATLLETSNDSIAEIAFATGFEDAAYFSRVFKRYMGKTPSAFRRVRLDTTG